MKGVDGQVFKTRMEVCMSISIAHLCKYQRNFDFVFFVQCDPVAIKFPL